MVKPAVLDESKSPAATANGRTQAIAETFLIFLLFFIQGGTAVPSVNEPHYLSKAKHYWNPDWCATDFFCTSADAHEVFYWTFGWLSLFVSLPVMAWCGRVLTWGLLAWAWQRLSVAIVPGRFYAVLSASLFVTLNDRYHMAGEWVIGGVEAKGFAYVFVLLALEAVVRAQWRRVLPLLGAACALHVIVGGWATVAATVAWWTAPDRPRVGTLLGPLGIAIALSLLGLWPALALSHGVAADLVAQANQIYVYERLPHHLVPEFFPPRMIVRHLLLIGVLVVLARNTPREPRIARLLAFVATAVGIAALGMIISLGILINPATAAGLLRYYWFRSTDVMVPLGVSLLLVWRLWQWQPTMPRRHVGSMVVVVGLLVVHFGRVLDLRHAYPAAPADAGTHNLAAWREACDWVAENTAPDAIFLTPRMSHTFRWYAGRGEVITRKDVPQDAAGIIEWWRRMNAVYRAADGASQVWQDSLAELGSARLRQLGHEFGADYVITSAYPALHLPRVGPSNPSYAIYRLPPAASSKRHGEELP